MYGNYPTFAQGEKLLYLLRDMLTEANRLNLDITQLRLEVQNVINDILVLNNNIYKVTYKEIINPIGTTTGTIIFPSGATLDTDDYPGNAILSTLTPTGEIAGETPVFNGSSVIVTLSTNGTWITSDFTNNPVAIVFRLRIKAADYQNLNQANVIDFSSAGGVGGASTQGPQGLSAYEVAVLNGFIGTEQDWLNSLVGPQGLQGPKGDAGDAGLSAYETAINNGFVGTESEWLNSLIGSGISDGDKGDITVSSSGAVWSINNGVVNNDKLSTMPANTVKGNDLPTAGPAKDLPIQDVLVGVGVTNASGQAVITDSRITGASIGFATPRVGNIQNSVIYVSAVAVGSITFQATVLSVGQFNYQIYII